MSIYLKADRNVSAEQVVASDLLTSSEQTVTNEEEICTQFGLPLGLGEMERDVVVTSPR